MSRCDTLAAKDPIRVTQPFRHEALATPRLSLKFFSRIANVHIYRMNMMSMRTIIPITIILSHVRHELPRSQDDLS